MKKFDEKNVAENPLYHDTWKLLKKYRDVVWSLELSVQHVRTKFEIEYGTSIEDFLDSVYLAGACLLYTSFVSASSDTLSSGFSLSVCTCVSGVCESSSAGSSRPRQAVRTNARTVAKSMAAIRLMGIFLLLSQA